MASTESSKRNGLKAMKRAEYGNDSLCGTYLQSRLCQKKVANVNKSSSMQEVISETLVDSIPKDGLFDILLHYGLFLGALFQLVCIFAVTFVPASDDENVSSCSAPVCPSSLHRF